MWAQETDKNVAHDSLNAARSDCQNELIPQGRRLFYRFQHGIILCSRQWFLYRIVHLVHSAKNDIPVKRSRDSIYSLNVYPSKAAGFAQHEGLYDTQSHGPFPFKSIAGRCTWRQRIKTIKNTPNLLFRERMFWIRMNRDPPRRSFNRNASQVLGKVTVWSDMPT
jgi:hypothetical protein